MKKFLLLFIGILFSGLAFADGISVKVVKTLDEATGTDTYVYNKEDGKIYAYNTKGEYELYGEYSRVNTLKTAAADLEIEYIENLELTNIMIDYVPKWNTRVECDAWITQTETNNEGRCGLFGSREYRSGWPNAFYFEIFYSGDNSGVHTKLADEAPFATDFDKITQTKCCYVLDGATGKAWVYNYEDETIYGEHQRATWDEGYNYQYKMGFFSVNQNNVAYYNLLPTGCRIYGAKIYEGDVLVMDIVPVVTGEGRPALKDKISGKKFYTSKEGSIGVSPDGEDALNDAGISAYEGKLVCLNSNNHEYKYTNGQWVDCGEMKLEPIADDSYKNMSQWTILAYPERFSWDPEYNYSREEDNELQYLGGGWLEPIIKELNLEQDETYNYSLDFESDPWECWINPMRACVLNGNPGKNTLCNGGGHDANADRQFILGSQPLPMEGNEGDPAHISIDFVAAPQNFLFFNFGYVADGNPYWFKFSHLNVSKYVYAETYSYAPQLAASVALAQEFLATAKTTTALKNQIDAEIAKSQQLIANRDDEGCRAEYYTFNELFDKVKANDFSNDVWARTIELCKQEKVDVSQFEDYMAKGTESTFGTQLYQLRMARWAKHMETGEFTERQASPVAEGDFYLYNVGTKNFLESGDNWGCQTTIGWPGILVTLSKEEGKEGYSIDTHMWNETWANSEYGGLSPEEGKNYRHYLNNVGYVDGYMEMWDFVPVEGKNNVYNIVHRVASSENPDGILACLGHDRTVKESEFVERSYYNVVGPYQTDFSDPRNQWMLITKEQRDALVDQASHKNPADLSYLINMPNFNNRQYSNESVIKVTDEDGIETQQNVGWREVWNTNGSIQYYGGSNPSSFNGDLNIEMFEGPASTWLFQDVEVPVAGYYGLSVTGYTRPGRTVDVAQAVADGEELYTESYLFANSDEVEMPLVTAYADKSPGLGSVFACGEIPNWIWEAAKFFQNGQYKVEVIFQAENDNELVEFGIDQRQDGAGTNYWTVVDNFRLKYYGEVDPRTGVEKVEADKVEGINDGKYYTLQGYAVERPTKRGIYIRNGKKIVVK